MNPASPGECFINQMSVAGAPADAVSFTRMLYQENDGQVGMMSMFKKSGPVDAAQVFYPLRANDNYALLLVNGDPKILDVDDLQKLDQAAMQQDALFQAIKKQYPNATLFPGDRSGNAPWPRVQPLPNGGQQFIVTYPLLNGCHACKHFGVARFGWDFDASGKFLQDHVYPNATATEASETATRAIPRTTAGTTAESAVRSHSHSTPKDGLEWRRLSGAGPSSGGKLVLC